MSVRTARYKRTAKAGRAKSPCPRCDRHWSAIIRHHLACRCGEYCTWTVAAMRQFDALLNDHDNGLHDHRP